MLKLLTRRSQQYNTENPSIPMVYDADLKRIVENKKIENLENFLKYVMNMQLVHVLPVFSSITLIIKDYDNTLIVFI